MRQLVLMRHAKTEFNNVGGDKARRLTSRGVQDAQDAGVALRQLGLDQALVSTSARTRETFAALGLPIPATFLDGLYLSGTTTIADLIGEVPSEVSGLLVLGHAPSIPDLAATLVYASDPAQADSIAGWFPTSTFSVFTFDRDWADLFDGTPAHHWSTSRPRH